MLMQPSLAFSQCFRLLLLLLVLNIAVFSVVALFASSTALMHIHINVCMHVHGYVRMYAYVLVFFFASLWSPVWQRKVARVLRKRGNKKSK